MTKTVYIAIGNSDDKLTQEQWADFYWHVNNTVRFKLLDQAPIIHGAWVSEPTSRWQNACWCAEVTPVLEERLRRVLPLLAHEFDQDSITWAEATTEFIKAAS